MSNKKKPSPYGGSGIVDTIIRDTNSLMPAGGSAVAKQLGIPDVGGTITTSLNSIGTAVTSTGTAAASIGTAAASIGKLTVEMGKLSIWIANPINILRLLEGAAGGILAIYGLHLALQGSGSKGVPGVDATQSAVKSAAQTAAKSAAEVAVAA